MNYDEQGAAPLFHRVVIEDGAPTARAAHPFNAPIHEKQFAAFVLKAGCSDHRYTSVVECLRNRPSSAIIDASNAIFSDYNVPPVWPFQPVIDNDIMKKRPTEAWESGIWNKVPIITGFNHNEGTMYTPTSTNTSEEFLNYVRVLSPKLSGEDMAEIDKLYPDPLEYPESPYVETRPIPHRFGFSGQCPTYNHRRTIRVCMQRSHHSPLCLSSATRIPLPLGNKPRRPRWRQPRRPSHL